MMIRFENSIFEACYFLFCCLLVFCFVFISKKNVEVVNTSG